MSGFHFGSADRPLYGYYHAPKGSPVGAAVICPSWATEYLFGHRSLRVLGDRLAAAGVHALRIDYRGIGDSWGGSPVCDLEGWKEDIGLAVEELKDLSDMDRVDLVGLRLGAWLVLQVSAGRPDLRRAIAWDPILHGPAWINEISRDSGWDSPPLDDPARRPDVLEFGRHRVSEQFLHQLRAIGPAQLSRSGDRDVVILDTRDGDDGTDPSASVEGIDGIRVERIRQPSIWRESVSIERGQTAPEAIDRIVDELCAP